MEKRLFSCGVFIALRKAFDSVHQKIILDRLHHYGFRGIVNKWFSSYLEDRTPQTTQIGSFISEGKKMSLLVFHEVLSWVHCFFLSLLTISSNVLKSFNFLYLLMTQIVTLYGG